MSVDRARDKKRRRRAARQSRRRDPGPVQIRDNGAGECMHQWFEVTADAVPDDVRRTAPAEQRWMAVLSFWTGSPDPVGTGYFAMKGTTPEATVARHSAAVAQATDDWIDAQLAELEGDRLF